MKSLIYNERGLTLIEILAALVILGIVLISVMSFFTQAAKFTAHNDEKLTNVQVAEEIIAEVRQGKYLSDKTFTRADKYKVEVIIEDGPEKLKLATVTVVSPDGAGIDDPNFTTQMYFKVTP